jgi:hypothetical protein
MELFVSRHSIVRKIWGKSDTILFIFAINNWQRPMKTK